MLSGAILSVLGICLIGCRIWFTKPHVTRVEAVFFEGLISLTDGMSDDWKMRMGEFLHIEARDG
jgi:hypothetical protein